MDARSPPLPPALSDALLRLAPVNLLLLNDDLICCYAAPIGDQLNGRPRGELIGRPVAEVLPAVRHGLEPVLVRAVREKKGWRHQDFRPLTESDASPRSRRWSVQVIPVATDTFRGVLMSWIEVEEQAAERDRLRAEVKRLRDEAHERNVVVLQILSDLRNAITPLSGYLQVIARRPEALKGRTPAAVINAYVLPRISEVLTIADRLRCPPIFTPQ